MPMKKCPTCGAVWYTDLLKCAFCGIEGVEQALPESVGQVMDRGKSAARAEPQPEPATEVAVLPPPPPEPEPPAPDVAPKPPEPEPAAATKTPAGVVPPAGTATAGRWVQAPPLPSATVPLAFGGLGIAAAAFLAATVWSELGRPLAVLVALAAAVLLPFAPFAWWTGQRYEARCRELGFRPALSGRLGRLVGTAATLLLALEGSLILFLAALRRLGDGP